MRVAGLAALVALVACIPYREMWRPEVRGVLVDAHGAPLAKVEVHACSVSRWWSLSHGCNVEEVRETDDAGAFAFDDAKRWDYIPCFCPSEAPLPRTLLYACAPGGLAAAYISGPEVELKVDAGIVTAPRIDPSGSDVVDFLARHCP